MYVYFAVFSPTHDPTFKALALYTSHLTFRINNSNPISNIICSSPSDSVLVIEYGYFSDLPSLPYDPTNPIDSSPDSLMYNITSVGTKKQHVGVGCVVGGSSAVNSQAFMRGTSEDYDRWGALGSGEDSEWTWEGILPYFKKVRVIRVPRFEMG